MCGGGGGGGGGSHSFFPWRQRRSNTAHGAVCAQWKSRGVGGELLPGRDGNSIQGDYAGWKVAFRRACHWSGREF